MSYLKFSFTLFMVVVTAFVLIYVVEGYYESRHSAPALPANQAVQQNMTVMDKVKGLFRQAAAPAVSEPVDFFQKNNDQPEVHHGLCVAAMTGDFEKTKMLLDAGISANTRDAFGIRAITRATLWGHYDVVKLLLERGANVNEKERLGVTLLMLAANQGDEKLLQLFLDHGAEVNAPSEDGETALTTAVRKGHNGIAEILKKAGAKTSGRSAPPKKAKKSQDDEMSSRSIADRLFSRDRENERGSSAPVSEFDDSQAVPEAAEPAQTLPAGDESELVNLPGEAPKALSSDALAWAANVSQASIQENSEPPAEEEKIAPRTEVREEPRAAVLPAVPKAPEISPVSATKKFEKTLALTPPTREEPLKPVLPVPIPAKPVSSETVKAKKVDLSAVPTEEEMLEQALLNLNEKRKSSPVPAPAEVIVPPPVQAAVLTPEPKVLPQAPARPAALPAQPAENTEIFSWHPNPPQASPKVSAPSKRSSGQGPRASQELLHACIVGDSKRVRSLIDGGADVNIRGALEMTPLMIASQDGNVDVVKILLLKGADIKAQNIVGQTALRLAMLRERRAVVALLQSYGAPE